MTPVPVHSADRALTSFAYHAGKLGSAQSGISVVLVDAASVKFLLVKPHGSENTSGEPCGLSPPGPIRIKSLVPGITVGAVIGFLHWLKLQTLDQRPKTQRYMTRDPVWIT